MNPLSYRKLTLLTLCVALTVGCKDGTSTPNDALIGDICVGDSCGGDVCEGDACQAGPVKLDILWVVDDSSSMCQEQQKLASSLKAFLATLKTSINLDIQVAVTSTNVCPKNSTGAVRGKFLYKPISTMAFQCAEQRKFACVGDSQCKDAANGFPDPEGWVCDVLPSGSFNNPIYACDIPAEIGADEHEGDVLFTVRSSCRYACDPENDAGKCEDLFGTSDAEPEDPAYVCECPGGDCDKVACMKPAPVNFCPGMEDTNDDGITDKWTGPAILNQDVADNYAIEWIKGNWTAPSTWDPAWLNLPIDDSPASVQERTAVRNAAYELLFACMMSVGAEQGPVCGGQEQGLRAAWMALDPAGENAAQSKSFLRDDAYLLVIVISDEDDCSAPEYFDEAGQVWKNYVDETADNFGCACMRDENGCLASGECDPSACLTNETFDPTKCQLHSPASMVNNLRSLKSDPSRVMFSAIVGDAVAGSTASPGSDLDQIRERFYDCKCPIDGSTSPLIAASNYICASTAGSASYGKRYIDVAKAFQTEGVGVVSNICLEDGIDSGLTGLANQLVTKITAK